MGDSSMKTKKKESVQEQMETAAARLKHTSSELDAVEQYLKDLEPACGTGDSSYDDRKKARADEIEALRKPSAQSSCRSDSGNGGTRLVLTGHGPRKRVPT